jgi:endo-1,4-beta-xylanase
MRREGHVLCFGEPLLRLSAPGRTAMIDRRHFLGASAAITAAAALPAGAAAPIGLDRLAQRKGIRFGTCLGGGPPHPGKRGGSFGDARYRALVAQQCGLITPENELKWQAVRPSAERFDFRAADLLIDWATAQGIGVRGHTLLWHREERFPAWVASHDYGTRPAHEAARLLTDHISTVATRYAATIHSFDVVNETVDPDSGALRETTLSRAFGGTQAMVDLAFRTARSAAPGAELVYNDYMSWEPGFAAHRAGVLKLLEGFRARGVPIDALGVQSHIAGGMEGRATPFGAREDRDWRDFLDAVTAMGYRLLITEFDVDDRALPAGIALRDKAVADYARAYLDLMLSYPQLHTLVAWGIVDRYSWLQNFRPRTDGIAKRPNPWDDDFRPTPLRDAIAAALAAAPGHRP